MNETQETAIEAITETLQDMEVLELVDIGVKTPGLLHIELAHTPAGDELTREEAAEATNDAIGVFEGILRDHPLLFDRAAVDFIMEELADGDLRVRYELPSVWFAKYHRGDCSLQTLVERVWDTAHIIDTDGMPRSGDELPELFDEYDVDGVDLDAFK